ncbi:MAG TPA: hypothetical protein VKA09_11315 [Nitrososphaeraceae archaeon]|nr:hypothetical protein [Nitrososphaeraceae archaeon]
MLQPLYGNRTLIAVVITLIATLITDISFLRTYDLIPKSLLLNHGVTIFIIIVLIYSVGQYLILRTLRYRTVDIRTKSRTLFSIDRGMTIVQYVLLASLAILVLQVLLTNKYSTHILTFSIAVSFGMGAFNLGVLAKLFLSWFKYNMHSILAIYGLASLSLTTVAIVTLLFVYSTLSYKLQVITPFLGGSTIFIPTYSVAQVLDGMNFVLSIISFLLTWIATFFLLKSYSKKMGEIKFLLVVSLPLVFFIVQFLIQFSDSIIMILAAGTTQYAVIFTLVFTFIKLLGAIMFGIAFWIIVRNLDPILDVRNFMIVAGIGYVFLFTSNQASSIVVAPYPPYGLTTFLFFALSSYLVLTGIYGSAISLAEDSRLRKTVRNYVQQKLLDDIALASVQREIYDRSTKIFREYKDDLYENSGLSTSLNDDEVRSYVEEVVKLRESELKKIREGSEDQGLHPDE